MPIPKEFLQAIQEGQEIHDAHRSKTQRSHEEGIPRVREILMVVLPPLFKKAASKGRERITLYLHPTEGVGYSPRLADLWEHYGHVVVQEALEELGLRGNCHFKSRWDQGLATGIWVDLPTL